MATSTSKKSENSENSEKSGNLSKLLDCTICNTLFDVPVTTSCGHTFCKECILKSIAKKPVCPFCQRCLRDKQSLQSKNIIIDKIIRHFNKDYSHNENNLNLSLHIIERKRYAKYIVSLLKTWEMKTANGSKLIDVSDIDPITLNYAFTKRNKPKLRYFKYDGKTYVYAFNNTSIRLKLIHDNPEVFNTMESVIAITHESIRTKSETNRMLVKKCLSNDPICFSKLKKTYEDIRNGHIQIQGNVSDSESSDSESTESFESSESKKDHVPVSSESENSDSESA